MNEPNDLNRIPQTMKEKTKNYVIKSRLAIIAAAMVGVATQFAFQGNVFANDKDTKLAPPRVHVDNTPVNREVKMTTSFAPIVKKVSPSVVRINITGKAPKEAEM